VSVIDVVGVLGGLSQLGDSRPAT